MAKAIAQGNLLSPKEVYDPYRDEVLPGRISLRQFHIRRIAYLVVHGWRGAILLGVGVPAFGRQPDWIVEDGNHRHAAAIFKGDTHILAEICGDLDYAKELLGLKKGKADR